MKCMSEEIVKMLRQDMIQDMATDIICAMCDVGLNPIGYDKAQDMADRILKSQESLGMLPPTIVIRVEPEGDICGMMDKYKVVFDPEVNTGSAFGNISHFEKSVNEWEKEG